MRLTHPNGFRNKKIVAAIIKQAVSGLAYFHSNGEIHR